MRQFDQVFVLGGDGSDTATLADTSSNDVIYVLPETTAIEAIGFYLQAIGFELTAVTATAGTDAALFFDSPGNDAITAALNDMQIRCGNGEEVKV